MNLVKSLTPLLGGNLGTFEEYSLKHIHYNKAEFLLKDPLHNWI